MAQTEKEQGKQQRPGRRQQERLVRQARRQRRQRIWISVAIIVVVIVLASLGYWQYPRITTLFQHPITATQFGPSCTLASSSPTIYSTKPAVGPTTPPSVIGSPKANTDGLQCLDLKVGSGSQSKTGSSVSVQYTGWLQSSGKKFDSSYDHGGQPFTVSLGQGQVIKGWDEGLVGMKPGGIRRLIIPAALGYGAQGQPPTIPPAATLIFDVMMTS